jgi:hypothetical protein
VNRVGQTTRKKTSTEFSGERFWLFSEGNVFATRTKYGLLLDCGGGKESTLEVPEAEED